MDYNLHNKIVSFIWSIADDELRDIYKRGDYPDVILPMTVLRRLDALLEPTKQKVLDMKQQLDEKGVMSQHGALTAVAELSFYNTSPFTMRDLKHVTSKQKLRQNFVAYLDGFSDNIQEIIDKLKFRNEIDTLSEEGILGALIEKYLNPTINLSPKPVYEDDGKTIRLPALDNHTMGTIFEELIRRFNEENNEEAGEHFTPRDVVNLMAELMFRPISDKIQSGTYLVYDGACGSGGMLTVADKRIQQIADANDKQVSIHLYGQETQGQTYAICKADLIIKGEGDEAENIQHGSTLSDDAFAGQKFDFMISNPPYGKSWKNDQEKLGGKSALGNSRFVIDYEDDPEFKLYTSVSDGQMLFLVNNLQKMKFGTKMGSRIAEVHNGSSLFTGGAGQGGSNIRRWILEKDWLEAIVALPENIFYNTGIATYVWILTNNKPPERKGKVQLIDASGWYKPLRKNLGNKSCEITEEQIDQVAELLVNPVENEHSKMFDNREFGYYELEVHRPLRLAVKLDTDTLTDFAQACADQNDEHLADIVQAVANDLGTEVCMDYNSFQTALKRVAKDLDTKLKKKDEKFIQEQLTSTNPEAEPMIKKTHKPDKQPADPLYGYFEIERKGKQVVVEYEPDKDLKDSEQVPLLEGGGIPAFFEREVFPYAPDAWIDDSKTKIGYSISFTKHFYKPAPMRTMDEIMSDIWALEKETDGLLEEIVAEHKQEVKA